MSTIQPLNRSTVKVGNPPVEKILQFGGGNFLRGFVDWMIDILNKETEFKGSVIVVKPTQRGDYKDLDTQGGLYHVILDGLIDGKQQSIIRLVECISRTIQPYEEWETYLATARQEEIRFIISNTTESGIAFSQDDDKNDHPPREFPAKLTLWLYERYRFFEGEPQKGCFVLPCELIENNGDILLKIVLEYADHFGLEAGFKSWVQNHNYFYNTLVDRIVSGYPEKRISEIEHKTGFRDPWTVAGERYHSWILAGDPALPAEFPFRKAGLNIKLVQNISDYRELKVRVLNGAHTSLVPVAYLAGKRTVDQAMGTPALKDFVFRLLSQEVKPTLTTIPEAETDEFIRAVIDRFGNTVLAHKLSDISLNSISKFHSRLLPTLKDYIHFFHKIPPRIIFGMSCLMLFYRGEWNGEKIPLRDEDKVLNFTSVKWADFLKGDISEEIFIQAWLHLLKVDSLAESFIVEIRDTIAKNLHDIRNHGVIDAIPDEV